jgi:hypothetical protein
MIFFSTISNGSKSNSLKSFELSRLLIDLSTWVAPPCNPELNLASKPEFLCTWRMSDYSFGLNLD